jgi:hypothetical protein
LIIGPDKQLKEKWLPQKYKMAVSENLEKSFSLFFYQQEMICTP